MIVRTPAVLLVTPVLPYPPDRGGKADVWRRALALRECGATVLLACPRNGDATDGLVSTAAAEAGIKLALFSRASSSRTLWRMMVTGLTLPLFSARRMPSQEDENQLTQFAQRLGINIVVSEGPWLWPLVNRIGRTLGCPTIYRSHNIEASYMRRQRELEQSVRAKASMAISFAGLKRFERRGISEADLLLDISTDDLAFWGHPRGYCLPPVPAPLIDASRVVPTDGVLFLGNLRAPNNLAGLKMLLEIVIPAVRRHVPCFPCHVVGSRPDESTERWIAAAGATLHKDVAEPMAWLMGARCIVNPVSEGSGVQLKTLDMLQTDRPIVTFAQGLRGLPSQVRETVTVVTSPAEFSDAILSLHGRGFPNVINRGAVREVFDHRAFFKLLSEVIA